MRWIALWTLTGLVVLAMPVTAEAGGSPRWKQVATATAPLVGDGTTVAWEESPGRVLVKRAGAPARIVREPVDCAGHPVAVGAGRFLLACSDSRNGAHITGYTVVETATGATRRIVVPTKDAGAGGEFPVFDQIGREWLAGPYEGLHVSDTFLLDWQNGGQLVGARDRFGPKRYLDLSLPSLGRRLCSPLRRRPIPDDGTFTTRPRYYSLLVRGQWALEGGGTAKLAGNLRLGRCGSHRWRRLGQGEQATLGAGWVSWIGYRRTPSGSQAEVHALRLRDQRTFRSAQPQPLGFSLAHTATALYASVPIGPDYDPRGYLILKATLPHPQR